MKKILPLLLAIPACLLFILLLQFSRESVRPTFRETAVAMPNDWVYQQRAYPSGKFNTKAYFAAAAQHRQKRAATHKTQSYNWVFKGPKNIAGRITDVEYAPSNPNTVYFGAASGGVFYSSNGGYNFSPIFDDYNHLSVGDLAVHPTQENTVYVGTGEANGAYNSPAHPGNGVYKTTNGGTSWTHLGLDSTEQISRVLIDPKDPDKIFVASMGRQYGKNSYRGIYRSTDGGANWTQIFYVNDSTGVCDLLMHPTDTDTLYAATWVRQRYPWSRTYAGKESGVWRSTDGGTNWARLTNGLPPTSGEYGRIGLTLTRDYPNHVFASYTDDPIRNNFMELYRSTDNGNSWSSMNANTQIAGLFGGFGWYFGQIRSQPNDPLTLYVLGVESRVTYDGGLNWNYLPFYPHADHHDLIFSPNNPNNYMIATDGGLYHWDNNSQSETFVDGLPITQFYQIEINPHDTSIVLGGTQDNGTLRKISPFAQNKDFERIFYGDGFYTLVHPVNPNIIFAEYQWGNIHKSTDGGYYFNPSDAGIDPYDRTNWNSPYIMDPRDPNVMYFGTERLYKSTDGGDYWFPISNDLSNGGGQGPLTFGTITTIAATADDNQRVYAGTDDGNVWVTTNGGTNWTNISSGLPNLYCTRVFSPDYDKDICYVTFSGYEYANFQPHVFKTTDGGGNWTDITGDLPRGPVNDIIEDPASRGANPRYLYVATDFAVMYSDNGGTNWYPMSNNMPAVPVFDLDLDKNTRTLVAGTYGRGIFTLDLNQVYTSAPAPVKPSEYALQVGPNPFSDQTRITLELEQSQTGSLELFDLKGMRVRTLKAGEFAPGRTEYVVPRNDLPAGQYLLRFISDHTVLSKKIAIL